VVNILTEEEIKERKEYLRATVSMSEVLYRYGIKVKWGRCKGFCHDGKDYNMKVFRNGCHCFVCGKSYDIFDATMMLCNCDFWTAFELLGGTEKQSFTSQRKAKSALRERIRRIAEAEAENKELHRIHMYITAYRELIALYEPFSDIWCESQNGLQLELYHLECMTEER
jgi:hypothetical protein